MVITNTKCSWYSVVGLEFVFPNTRLAFKSNLSIVTIVYLPQKNKRIYLNLYWIFFFFIYLKTEYLRPKFI